MSEAINWDLLQQQFLSTLSYARIFSKSSKIIDSPLACLLSIDPGYFLEWYSEETNV